MPSSFFCKFVAGVLLFGLTAMGQAQEIGSRWLLRVMDSKHEVKVEATVRFLGELATESCMGGIWKRVVVEARTFHDEKFFPLAEPLAYQLEGDELTLGRTAVCDGYLFLSGKRDQSTIQGTYDAVSIGTGQKLGYFTLKKVL